MLVSELKSIIDICKKELDKRLSRRIHNNFANPTYPDSINSLEAFLKSYDHLDHAFSILERFSICIIVSNIVKDMKHQQDIMNAEQERDSQFYYHECVMLQTIRSQFGAGESWRAFKDYLPAFKLFIENQITMPFMLKAFDRIVKEQPHYITSWSKLLVEVFQLGFRKPEWINLIVEYLINIDHDVKEIVPALKQLREAEVFTDDTMRCLFKSSIDFSILIGWFVKLKSVGIFANVLPRLMQLPAVVGLSAQPSQQQILRINLIVCSWVRLAEKGALNEDATLYAIENTPSEQIEDMTWAIITLHADGKLTAATLSFLQNTLKMPVLSEQLAECIVSLGIEGLPIEPCLSGLLRKDREETISLFAYLNKVHLLDSLEIKPLLDKCDWQDSAKLQQQLERLAPAIVTADLFKLMCKHNADPMLADILLLLCKERQYYPAFITQLNDSSNPLPWIYRWLLRIKQEVGLKPDLIAFVPQKEANKILSQCLKVSASSDATTSLSASVAQSSFLAAKKTQSEVLQAPPALQIKLG